MWRESPKRHLLSFSSEFGRLGPAGGSDPARSSASCFCRGSRRAFWGLGLVRSDSVQLESCQHNSMATQPTVDELEKREEEAFRTGPLSVLTTSVKSNSQVAVSKKKIDVSCCLKREGILDRTESQCRFSSTAGTTESSLPESKLLTGTST